MTDREKERLILSILRIDRCSGYPLVRHISEVKWMGDSQSNYRCHITFDDSEEVLNALQILRVGKIYESDSFRAFQRELGEEMSDCHDILKYHEIPEDFLCPCSMSFDKYICQLWESCFNETISSVEEAHIKLTLQGKLIN